MATRTETKAEIQRIDLSLARAAQDLTLALDHSARAAVFEIAAVRDALGGGKDLRPETKATLKRIESLRLDQLREATHLFGVSLAYEFAALAAQAGVHSHNHSDLTLDDGTNPHGTTKGDVGLSNVTNDAQLKRSAGDFATFTEKLTPVSADLLLIEDSAAADAKKKIQIGNLPGSGGAPTNAQYVTMALDATLTQERVLAAGSGIGLADGGAGGNATVSMNITGLTDEPSVDTSADKVAIYDNSAAANRKTTVSNLWAKQILGFLTPADVQPQGSGTQATPGARGNHKTIDFDDTTEEFVVFERCHAPPSYRSGTIQVIVKFVAAATSGQVRFGVQIEALESQDLDTSGFAGEQLGESATSGTSGVESAVVVQLTNAQADSIGPDQSFRVRVARKVGIASNMSGDAQVTEVRIKEL